MKKVLKTIWRRQPVLSVLFALLLGVAVIFGLRTVLMVAHWGPPPARQQPIEGWMTPRYVAVSWDIPKPEMFAIMSRVTGMQDPPDKPMPLERIAEKNGMSEATLIDALAREITAYHADHPDRQ